MTKIKKSGFEELNNKLDRVIDSMTTREDIARLDNRINELEAKFDQRFHDVLTAIDRLAKTVSDLALEYAAVKTQLARHEEWIHILAKKAKVKLDF